VGARSRRTDPESRNRGSTLSQIGRSCVSLDTLGQSRVVRAKYGVVSARPLIQIAQTT
jgi:hypothetical protein